MVKTKIIIVGNGMVGYKFCEKLVAKAGIDTFDITLENTNVNGNTQLKHLKFASGLITLSILKKQTPQ